MASRLTWQLSRIWPFIIDMFWRDSPLQSKYSTHWVRSGIFLFAPIPLLWLSCFLSIMYHFLLIQITSIQITWGMCRRENKCALIPWWFYCLSKMSFKISFEDGIKEMGSDESMSGT